MSGKLRWALIGIGRFNPLRGGVNAIAYAHAEALKRNADKFDLVAGASLEQQNLDDFCREFPCNGYLDMNELFAKEKPDGVTISTYAPAREEHVTAAIRAGVKYILIEKPLALSFGAITRMKAEAEKYGARLFVNFQRRYGKPFELAKEAVVSGKLGKISSVELFQPCSNLLDFGPHFINSGLFFLNESEPVSVLAAAEAEGEEPWHGMFVEKRMTANILFKDGIRMSISACPENDSDLPIIRINGSEGFAELYMNKSEDMKSIYRCMTKDGLENPAMDENFHHGDEDRFLYFERCYADIASSITNNTPCRVDLEYGARTQQILLAAYASAQQHRMIEIRENSPEPNFRFS